MFSQYNKNNTLNNEEEKPFYANKLVIGVDEVGRGCFMGDVVTCACIISAPVLTISKSVVSANIFSNENSLGNTNSVSNKGVDNNGSKDLENTANNANTYSSFLDSSLLDSNLLDSKLMKKQNRLDAVKQLLNNGAIFAINNIDAKKIDEINILQATLLCMRGSIDDLIKILNGDSELMRKNAIKACNILGINCICEQTKNALNNNNDTANITQFNKNIVCTYCNYIEKQSLFLNRCQKFIKSEKSGEKSGTSPIAVLVDGNHAPANMWKDVCAIVPFIKGDSKHKPISAASIIAKEYRDWDVATNMHPLFPYYHWNENFGYGTKTHIEAIKQHGITPLHRVSFLKKILPHARSSSQASNHADIHAGISQANNNDTAELL